MHIVCLLSPLIGAICRPYVLIVVIVVWWRHQSPLTTVVWEIDISPMSGVIRYFLLALESLLIFSNSVIVLWCVDAYFNDELNLNLIADNVNENFIHSDVEESNYIVSEPYIYDPNSFLRFLARDWTVYNGCWLEEVKRRLMNSVSEAHSVYSCQFVNRRVMPVVRTRGGGGQTSELVPCATKTSVRLTSCIRWAESWNCVTMRQCSSGARTVSKQAGPHTWHYFPTEVDRHDEHDESIVCGR